MLLVKKAKDMLRKKLNINRSKANFSPFFVLIFNTILLRRLFLQDLFKVRFEEGVIVE